MDSGLEAWKKFNKIEDEIVEDTNASEKDFTKRYTWGTRKLDTNFAIIKRTDLIVFGAKRGVGKTIYAFDMATKNAMLGHKILFISLEMTAEEIRNDIARKYAGWTIQEEYDYNIPEFKKQSYERRLQEIFEIKNLYFEGMRRGADVKWDNILGIIGKYKDLDLIFIDNLDKIGCEKYENNLDKQKRIIDNMMGFTADKQIPIVLIHHHRKNTTGKDYGMDELSGSGKIADGADRVLKIIHDPKPDTPYPEKFKTDIFLQKARGYAPSIQTVYFIRGTFVDTPPTEEEYRSTVSLIPMTIGEYELSVSRDEELPPPSFDL